MQRIRSSKPVITGDPKQSFFKIGVYKNFVNFTGKHFLFLESLFNKIADLWALKNFFYRTSPGRLPLKNNSNAKVSIGQGKKYFTALITY